MASINDLSIKEILTIKERISAGEYQHIIASDFGVNQGRINEIATGKRFGSIQSAYKPKSKNIVKVIHFAHAT